MSNKVFEAKSLHSDLSPLWCHCATVDLFAQMEEHPYMFSDYDAAVTGYLILA